MALAYLFSVLAVLMIYPAYFLVLSEFKMRLMRDHPGIWAQRAGRTFAPPLSVAYKALREVKEGRLDGTELSAEVAGSHRIAVVLLYAGLIAFLALLFLGLYDALWGVGRR